MFTKLSCDWKPGAKGIKTPGIDYGTGGAALDIRVESKQEDGSYFVVAHVQPTRCWAGIGVTPRYVAAHFVLFHMEQDKKRGWVATSVLQFDARTAAQKGS